ncbi:cupin domain-containing protein [Planctomycetota bacterium]
MDSVKNLFEAIPKASSEEFLEVLCQTPQARVERIVSNGHQSPKGFWFDQEDDECVFLLTGKARLEFKDPHGKVSLKPGDWLNIPAHRRHRVAWTQPDTETVWLAIFFKTAKAET